MYDPSVGQWLEEDPILFAAGDANLERYVGNDPTNATDPSGLAAWHSYVAMVGGTVADAAGAALAGMSGQAQPLYAWAERQSDGRPQPPPYWLSGMDADAAWREYEMHLRFWEADQAQQRAEADDGPQPVRWGGPVQVVDGLAVSYGRGGRHIRFDFTAPTRIWWCPSAIEQLYSFP
jgi:hypothetical protein